MSSLELVVICLYCSNCLSANFISAVVYLFIDYLVEYLFCDNRVRITLRNYDRITPHVQFSKIQSFSCYYVLKMIRLQQLLQVIMHVKIETLK